MLHQIFSTTYLLLAAYSLIQLPDWIVESDVFSKKRAQERVQKVSLTVLGLLIILRLIEGIWT